jgi:ribonuclease-3
VTGRLVDPARTAAADDLADRLGHRFANRNLFEQALTHRSWCAEQPGFVDNERLEFLGDAVLGVVVTEQIFCDYPHMPEGELAKLRSSVVSAATLAEVGLRLEAGASVRLGKGEEASGGRTKPSILADLVEALIGAVYLDAGLEGSRSLVLGLLGETIVANAEGGPGHADHKTQLQELAARQFEQLPAYDVRAEGPDHQKRFFASVRLGGVVRGTGEGRTKKQAEQAAARDACEHLEPAAIGAALTPSAAPLPDRASAARVGAVAVEERPGPDGGAATPRESENGDA